MKKMLLALLCLLSFTCLDATAQRRTDYCDVSTASFSGTCKYSYVLRNGERVYDGPVSVTIDDDREITIGLYGTYYTSVYYLDLSLTANNSNGCLSGPVKLKSVERAYGYDEPEETDTQTLSGNFVTGLPSGKFVFNRKKSKNGGTRQVENFSATFNKGLLTGAFLWQRGDDEIRGSFTSSGKLDGKWSVKGKTYQFKNGVLIEGEGFSSQEKDYAIKFANNQITEQQLLDNGMKVEERDLGVYEEFVSRLNALVSLAAPLKTADFDSGKFGDNYKVISQATFFTEKGYNDFVERFIHSGKRVAPDEYISSLDDFTCLDKDTGMRYGVEYEYNGIFEHTGAEWILPGRARGYYFTKDQLERVKKEVEKHNHAVLKRRIQPYFAQNNISFDNVNYSVFRYNIAEDKGCGNGYVVELDGRPANSNINSGQYSSFIANFSFDDKYKVVLSSIQRVRNKYDELNDVITADIDAIVNVKNYLQQLKNAHVIDSYEDAVEVQLAAFNSKIRDIDINHNDLDATIKSYKDQTAMVNHFHAYMKYYPQAKDLEAQIANKQISVYTTTSSPVIPDWSKSLDLESMKSLVATQQSILKQYDDYCALKSKSAENHNQIVAKKLSVLSLYNDMYMSTTSAIVSLEEGIKQYSDLLAAQQSVEQYIALYEQVVANNEELSSKLKPTKCAANAYQTYYKSVDLNWVAEGSMEHVKELLATQQTLLKQYDDYCALKSKSAENHSQIVAKKLSVLSLYNDMYKSTTSACVSLEEGIKQYSDLLAAQQSVEQYISLYEQVVANNEELSSKLKSEKCAAKAYQTYYKSVDLNWVAEGSMEHVKELLATQQTLLKQYDDYCALKSKSAENHSQIVAKKLSVLSLYNDMYKRTTSACVSLEEGIKQYSDLLAAQQSVEQYISLYEQVVANNEELSSKLKPAKCAAKAYQSYYKSVDLNWVAEGSMEHVKELLAKQQALLEISKRSTLAQDEKRIKSMKLTNLDDIIKAY